VRITRPGLNFLQDNLSTLAVKALGTSAVGGVASFAIPPSKASIADVCSVAPPSPAQCKPEINLGTAKLRVNAITPNRVKLDGLLPVRIRDIPVAISFAKAFVVAGDKSQAPGNNLCAQRGSADMAFKEFPLNVELPLISETRIPRNGYTKVDIANATIDIGITENDVEICDDTCGGLPFCQGAFNAVKTFAFDTLVGGIKDQVKSALGSAFCTAPTPTVTPPCPLESEPNDPDLTKATQCLYKTAPKDCVPSLLGADGRMDLSKALASFSPGASGGLDFVLAAAGDMDPKPNAAGPASPWATPRKPPVPAEDNNANGLSLSMLGGTIPQPQSACVAKTANLRPENIPIPKELQGDVITPWPANTAGPHLGIAIAGRFLEHAGESAYNSGVLCLGMSTEQVEQLSTGYLSILVPSIKLLTFEQNPAAAAITTRPGAPPKIKIGNGTNLKTDPLLTITLPKFAVDFYVWSLDRFVRFFTYTADVTVPINIQTGKDAKNPNGGLLPVIGDIALANPSVTNFDLLLDDPAMVSSGVTGLLGGIVSQFLGGGFSPIDLQTTLASFGLGLDIPAGGIRKLTSGTDDFLAIFANLSKAAGTAHEEADTRASLVDKVVYPDSMGLSAVRARFPTLRIHAEGLASRPTEQTWWIDQGTHSAWTTDQDIVVDHDTMLLQGKHVLHVSSRVVGDMASEDGTPVELPFTIDTLAPQVEAKREGARVAVRARDLVSSESALVARTRVGEGNGWSEWAPLASVAALNVDASTAVDVEVRDEEGNIGRVSSPLIRGKADSTLAAAGSGCGCRTTGTGGSGAWLALGLGLALCAVVRARRKKWGPARSSTS